MNKKINSDEIMLKKLYQFLKEHGEYPSPFFVDNDEEEILYRWYLKVFSDDNFVWEQSQSTLPLPLTREEMPEFLKNLRSGKMFFGTPILN